MITSEQIKTKLWNGANELRGSMDASRYKDYMLGLMFYKFLSDKTLETFRTMSGLEKTSEAELVKNKPAEEKAEAQPAEKPAYTGKKRGRKPGSVNVKKAQPEPAQVKRGRGRPRKNPQ